MDEYIKQDDALDALLYALVGTGYQSRAMDAIKDVPTADVIPKSALLDLKREIHDKATYPHGRDTYSFVNLKVFDAVLNNYLNDLTKKEK